MRSRLLVVALLALAVVSAVLAAVIVHRGAATAPQAAEGRPLIGGPFALVDQDGREVTQGDFRGRWMLLYFGYTSCPDMCPLGLQVMAQALDELPPALAERVVPVLVTVDPERDTVQALRDYVELFHPRLIGLTGSPAQVTAAVKAWRVYVRKRETQPDGSYLVDHSTFTYLMGPDGGYVTHFGSSTSPEAMAKKLVELLGAA